MFYGYDFIKPSDYIYKCFYSNIESIAEKKIRADDDITDILILGGSVISPGYLNLEPRLNALLNKHYKGTKKVAIYNVAAPAHTSLDNLLKYDLLRNQHFDLVIYYEAINDLHAGNISDKLFRADYSHIKWYSDIYILLAHPEIDISVIPYVVDKAFRAIKDKIQHKTYLGQYGSDLTVSASAGSYKSINSYHQNLSRIITIAHSRKESLLLMSYASCFPLNVTLTGKQSDMQYFAGCKFATPVTMWGKAEYVKAGIAKHNKILKNQVKKHDLAFMDMENALPQEPALFCDVCHLSEAGAQRFAKELASYIISKKILD
ncbi:hypothetical protein ASG33_13550 [Dyadobacter sp. Leaf189]|nr:hypothetical protein ASG33_13550 [Dyadobacter sp. Leaf189]